MLDLILCVDDDPITLMLCKMVILKTSFAKELVTAQNGEEAINYFDELKLNNLGSDIIKYPELIFLDLKIKIYHLKRFWTKFILMINQWLWIV